MSNQCSFFPGLMCLTLMLTIFPFMKHVVGLSLDTLRPLDLASVIHLSRSESPLKCPPFSIRFLGLGGMLYKFSHLPNCGRLVDGNCSPSYRFPKSVRTSFLV